MNKGNSASHYLYLCLIAGPSGSSNSDAGRFPAFLTINRTPSCGKRGHMLTATRSGVHVVKKQTCSTVHFSRHFSPGFRTRIPYVYKKACADMRGLMNLGEGRVTPLCLPVSSPASRFSAPASAFAPGSSKTSLSTRSCHRPQEPGLLRLRSRASSQRRLRSPLAAALPWTYFNTSAFERKLPSREAFSRESEEHERSPTPGSFPELSVCKARKRVLVRPHACVLAGMHVHFWIRSVLIIFSSQLAPSIRALSITQLQLHEA